MLSACAVALAQPVIAQESSRAKFEALVAAHARANGVPASLVHRVIVRESRYRPRAVGRGGALGLMQIKLATARGLGYRGSAQGLLDPETNLKYAVRYLAGAYRVAGGNPDRAVRHYASGYYYAAKRKGMLETLAKRERPSTEGKTMQALASAAMDSRASVPEPKRLDNPEIRTVW
jgi:soluble lytic murein transglycosylase-like protein